MHNLIARRVVASVRRVESRCWIFALLLLAACGKSPVDAIVPETSGPDGGDPCDGVGQVTAGLFRLRSTGNRCLSVGGVTMVGLSSAHETEMLDDCSSSEIWELKPMTTSLVAGIVYELEGTSVEENLDIYMGMTDDGTHAITFGANGFPNQRFVLRRRQQAGVFELAPVNVPGQTSCLSSAPPAPAIQPCSAAASDQEWALISPECM